MEDELPTGWRVLNLRRDGLIEVENDRLNVVVQGMTWHWVKQRCISMSLSARVEP
jgi:hypothetical protein